MLHTNVFTVAGARAWVCFGAGAGAGAGTVFC